MILTADGREIRREIGFVSDWRAQSPDRGAIEVVSSYRIQTDEEPEQKDAVLE